MTSQSEIVIGAKSNTTGLFESWAIKDGYYVDSWKKEMAGYGYELHEMHVSDMLDIVDNQRGKTAHCDA